MRGDARRLFADRRAAAGAAVLALAVLAALLAPLLAGDPIAQREIVATRFLPPFATDPFGAFHLLGTDRFGRDVWARLIYGARVSLGVGMLAVLLSVVIGVAVGAVAGFWRGWVGVGLLGLTDFALALPRVVLLLLLASLWQPSAGLVILVLGLTGWMTDRATGPCGGARAVESAVRRKRGRAGGPGTPHPAASHPAQRAHTRDRRRRRSGWATPSCSRRDCPSSGSACSRRRRRGGT